MAKRFILGIALILILALAVVLAVPASRYWILALVRNEPLHGGRSVSS